jgi:dTDP-4-amino-4,6-dideoxygalactose transaminase
MEQSYPMLSRYVIPDMPSADELLPYMRQIDEGRWYSNFGPLTTRFENRLVRRLSADGEAVSVTTVASCYHALQIALQIFRLPADARVLVPAVTFPACPHAVRHAGAEPVLADIDAATWQLNPDAARRIAEKMPIHAVMPVAVYGVPVPVEAWDRFMEDTGIPVVIDAAAALEAQPIPQKALVAFSLHATKPFSIGEGGLLAARDRRVIDEARAISNFGTQQRITLQDGMNAKISEYAGAVALAQLDRWDGIKERRRKAFALYREAIGDTGMDAVFQPGIEQAIVSALMLRTQQAEGSAIVNALNGQGIAAHRMYLPPLYHHPHFTGLMVVNGEGKTLPRAASTEDKAAFMAGSEMLHRCAFGVPFHAFLAEADIAHAVRALSDVIGRPRARALRS